MRVTGIKEQEGTLKKLKNLLDDSNRKIHGVFYTNSFFSQRYLCRSHAIVDNINIEDNQIKLTVTTRLEKVGMMEIENTLDMLVRHKAGDIPGFTPEGIMEDEAQNRDMPHIVEPISVNQFLLSLDLLLIIKDPKITYQEFTIAGSKFTLLNIHHVLDEDEAFEQTVTLLFGEADKLYLFSHFYNKELSLRDLKLIMDLIVDENITGKAITAVTLETESLSVGLFPLDSLISSYQATNGDYIFNSLTAYIRVAKDSLEDYKLTCSPNTKGSYRLDLESKGGSRGRGRQETIRIYFE